MDKNTIIRRHFAATAQARRSKNCFRWGAVEIKIDPSGDGAGKIRVSIYDPETDTDLVFTVKNEDVEVYGNALGG